MSSSVQQTNEELARQINDEARRNPQSPYAGKFVGIADGSVVVVADNLDDVAARLQREADPSRTFCIEVGIDYDAVAEITKANSWIVDLTDQEEAMGVGYGIGAREVSNEQDILEGPGNLISAGNDAYRR